MIDKVKYWFDLAREDVDVSRVLIGAGKYLYSGFVCHLCVEKALKAVIAKNETPPKIHDLVKLAKIGNIYVDMDDDQKSFLEVLLPLQIEGRYPSYKGQILSSLNEARCREILGKVEEFLSWIEKQL
jgi:HEPN domain-containing protein